MEYPKFTRLKQATIKKSPSEPIDSRNTTGAKIQKEEKLLEIMGEPEDLALQADPGLEEPVIAPDDFIDPTAIGKIGMKMGYKGMPMAAGVIAQSLKGTRPFKVLGLKAGEHFREALGKILKNEGEALGSTAIEKSGKTGADFLKSKEDELVSKGMEIIKQPSDDLHAMYNIDAGYIPEAKKILLPDDIADENYMAGLVEHESKHVDEVLRKMINPNDITNYTELSPEKLAQAQKLFPDVKDYKDLRNKIMDLMEQERYIKGAQAQNIRKIDHFADPNIKDLERDEALKFLYDQSKDVMLPGEIDLLNAVNPRIINPIETKKAALELLKKKKR